MQLLSSIVLSLLLHRSLSDTPPVRQPTNVTNDGPLFALENLPGGLNKGSKTNGFIVGGTLAARGDFPSFVKGNGCGGNLIHEDIVLTAAHCKPAFGTKVLVGAMIAGSTRQGAEWRNVVSQKIIHPLYNANKVKYDFMIFKIEKSTKPPSPINSNPSYPVPDQKLQVCGFGTTSEGGTASKNLRKVVVPYIPPSTCNGLYGGLNETVELCAGVLSGGKDSCQGDSGGPLFDLNGMQVGVVSWGFGCARANKPGIYSRISGAHDWINQQICTLSSSPPSWCNGGAAPAPAPTTALLATPAPTASPLTRVNITVNVQYDAYPEEFGWSIKDTTTLQTVVNYPPYTFFKANKFLSGTVELIQGRAYKLVMKDKYGDGICCKDGNGYLEVLKGSVSLLNVWGDIGSSYSTLFTP